MKWDRNHLKHKCAVLLLPPFYREVRHLQVVEIIVKNFSKMGCDQGATTPSYWAGRLDWKKKEGIDTATPSLGSGPGVAL